jgi:polar amino acid transport system ATP-binding protein/sulfate transport system ATP-binding protein
MNYTLGESLLRIENVSFTAGDFPILTGVNAEVRKIEAGECHGQVVGFLGLSGSGKTTLFRIIAGLVKPTTGRVVLNHADKPVHPGEVGVVAQNYPLFDHRTVYSNLLIAAKKKTPNEKEAHDRVLAYLEEFQLMERRSAYPAQLSGGQEQRVAIIQQVLCSEHFLLFDEPFSGLDVKMEDKTIALIQKVASMDAFNTVIVVTHDVTAACSVADHLWVLGGAREENGKRVEGSRIVREYNLLDNGLCWHPELVNEPVFTDFVRDVKAYFKTL